MRHVEEERDSMQPDRHNALPRGLDTYAAFVLDAFGAADYELNLLTGVLRPSPRLNALYGYPTDHLLTVADCRSRLHPDDHTSIDTIIAEVLARGASHFQREFRLMLPGGDVLWVLFRGEVVCDAGQPAWICGTAVDITAHKRAKEQLAAATARDEFRIRLADAVRLVSDPTVIQGEAARVLGEHLGANRVAYFEVLGSDYVVAQDYVMGARPIAGHFPINSFGLQLLAAYEAGRVVVSPDIDDDPDLAPSERAAYAALQIAAYVGVPLVKDGQFVAGLAVHMAAPRAWTPDEMLLIEETAERTWAAVEQARAEADVHESEARYRSLLDSIDQGFCLFEMLYDPTGAPIDYRFLQVNRTFERHTGLHDAVGKTARELVPSLESHWVKIYGQVAATGEPLRFEQDSAAMGRWFEVEAVRVGAAERHQVALIFTDITARRQADADAYFLSEVSEQIRVSEDADQLLGVVAHLLGRHVQVARCCFCEIDDQGDQWMVHHEYRLSATLPTRIGDYPLSAFPQPVLASLRAGRSVCSDDTARDERTAPHYETAYQPLAIQAFIAIPLRHNGRWVASLGVSTETPHPWTPREVSLLETVAERTWNAVEKLRLATAQRAYAARLQMLNTASLLINAAPTCHAVLHLTADQARALIGAHQSITSTTTNQSWSQAITAVSLSEKYAPWQAVATPMEGFGIPVLNDQITTPTRLTHVELEAHPVWSGVVSETANRLPMRGWLGVPLVGRDGRIFGLIQLSDKVEGEFTADDEALLVQLAQVAAIALENQHLYVQEQVARAQAEEASRLKDEFLATVSHELRTPLTALLGYAELLLRRKRDEAYITRMVEKMMQSAKAQAALVEDLLDVSRIVSGKMRIQPKPIDLTHVIHAAIDTVRPTVEAKGLHVQLSLDPAARAVLGDANRLQQVIWNLLANATKFTPPGGRIVVRLARAGSMAELSVGDSGQGIHSDFLPYVFDRFRQADSSRQQSYSGLGLGLAIVRHLVELHGGTVNATSDGVGHGAIFTVRLPVTGTPDPGSQAGRP